MLMRAHRRRRTTSSSTPSRRTRLYDTLGRRSRKARALHDPVSRRLHAAAGARATPTGAAADRSAIPNSPSGTLTPVDVIAALVRGARAASSSSTRRTSTSRRRERAAAPRAPRQPRSCCARSRSRSRSPGMRIGLAFGHPELLAELAQGEGLLQPEPRRDRRRRRGARGLRSGWSGTSRASSRRARASPKASRSRLRGAAVRRQLRARPAPRRGPGPGAGRAARRAASWSATSRRRVCSTRLRITVGTDDEIDRLFAALNGGR